jgi:hypothetical protein
MKHLKLKHGYHDGIIRAIRYRNGTDVALDIDLCSCCNPSPDPAALSLLGLRNFPDVQRPLESARQANAERGFIDEIVDILRDDERGYLFDLMTAGEIRVDARGLHEA